MSHRNIQYLNSNRIVYRQYSSDEPTNTFNWGWHYEDGTYGYYCLFNTKAKINSYKSFKWHLLVLWYLNPQLTMDEFKELSEVDQRGLQLEPVQNVAPLLRLLEELERHHGDHATDNEHIPLLQHELAEADHHRGERR